MAEVEELENWIHINFVRRNSFKGRDTPCNSIAKKCSTFITYLQWSHQKCTVYREKLYVNRTVLFIYLFFFWPFNIFLQVNWNTEITESFWIDSFYRHAYDRDKVLLNVLRNFSSCTMNSVKLSRACGFISLRRIQITFDKNSCVYLIANIRIFSSFYKHYVTIAYTHGPSSTGGVTSSRRTFYIHN